MELSLKVVNQVSIIVLLMAVGFFCHKIGMLTQQGTKQLTNLILHVVTPALILSCYQTEFSAEKAWNLLFAFILALVSIGLGVLVSNLLRILLKDKNSQIIGRLCVAYSNCGFMALPLVESITGSEGLFYGSAFVVAFNIIVWTHGVSLCSQQEERKLSTTLRKLLSPSLISILIGMPLFFLQIRLPGPFHTTVEYIASLNTPLAMLTAGAIIAQSNWKETFLQKKGYGIAALRLILIPVLMILLLRFIPVNNTLKIANLIATACPTATICVFFAGQYGRDEQLASQTFTLTNLFCIITIPAMVTLATFLW